MNNRNTNNVRANADCLFINFKNTKMAIEFMDYYIYYQSMIYIGNLISVCNDNNMTDDQKLFAGYLVMSNYVDIPF